MFSYCLVFSKQQLKMPRKENQSNSSSNSASHKKDMRNSSSVSSGGLPNVLGAMSVKFSNEDKQSKISDANHNASTGAPAALSCTSDYEHLYAFSSSCSAEPRPIESKKARQLGKFAKVAANRSSKTKSGKVKKSIPQGESTVSSVADPNIKVVKPPTEVMPPVKKINKKGDSPPAAEESSCACCLIM